MKLRALFLSGLLILSIVGAGPGLVGAQTETANSTPVANPDTVSANENATAAIPTAELLANDTDPDEDDLTVTGATSRPSDGSLSFNGTAFEYTPDAGFTGADSFVYEIEDGAGSTDNAEVTIDVDGNSTFTDVEASDLAGSGTESDPYIITNASELQALEDDLDGDYVLGNDIDASGTAEWNDGDGFDPVGDRRDTSTWFTGSLDGDSHTITGLTIDRDGEHGVALLTGFAGTVENIAIEDAEVVGDRGTAILVGWNQIGTVRNASVNGTVEGAYYVGGLVASHNDGEIRDSSAAIRVTGEGRVGGLVGNASDGTVTNGSATGTVEGGGWYIGGLIGEPEADIASSSANVTVEGGRRVGGLAGETSREAQITDSRVDGRVSGFREVGGLVGESHSERVANASVDVTVSGEENVGGLIGVNRGRLVRNVTVDGAVTGDRRDIGGLVGVNEGSIEEASVRSPVSGSDIVGGLVGRNRGPIETASASGAVTGEEGVGGLIGVSAGDNIENVSSSGDVDGDVNVGGLFGSGGGAVSASASGEVNGTDNVGGLIGNMQGHDLRAASASGDVNGTENVGGLIGQQVNYAEVDNASATGTVDGSTNVGGLVGHTTGRVRQSVATGHVNGSRNVGGLAGSIAEPYPDIDNGVSDSVAHGSVTGETNVGGLVGAASDTERKIVVERSFATGDVTGVNNTGGLIGDLVLVSSTGSYWDRNTTGQATSVDGTGLTTAQMTGTAAQTNMTALDFGSVWERQAGDYPKLAWRAARDDNTPPVAADDTLTATENTTLSVTDATLLANDADADGDDLTLTGAVSQPTNGTLTFADGTVNYTPETGFTGEDSFVYEVEDPSDDTDTATVTITVEPAAADPPTVTVGNETVRTDENGTINVTLSDAPEGLSGYKITVTSTNTTVVTQETATVPPTFALNETTTRNGTVTEITATDLDRAVEPGASGIRLAELTVNGAATGETDLDVTVEQMDDDDGGRLDPATDNGSVTVEGCTAVRPSLADPTDLDSDGDYEDVNGNGRLDFQDVVILFEELDTVSPECYDYNDNGRIDYGDIRTLFEHVSDE